MTHTAGILGMFKYKRFISDFDDGICAIVHTSKDPVTLEVMQSKFVHEFKLGADPDTDYYVVPMYTIVQPLIAYKNHGGPLGQHFCTLPRRRWARYFGDNILLLDK